MLINLKTWTAIERNNADSFAKIESFFQIWSFVYKFHYFILSLIWSLNEKKTHQFGEVSQFMTQNIIHVIVLQ